MSDIEMDLLLLKTARGGKVSPYCALAARAVIRSKEGSSALEQSSEECARAGRVQGAKRMGGGWVIPRLRGQGG